MLFNSLEFLIFSPDRLCGVLVSKSLDKSYTRSASAPPAGTASYVFYGWWDWRFLSLIAFSTLVDFAVGLQIAKANAAT